MARGVNQTMAWVVAVVFASTIFGVVLLITSHIAKKSEDRFKAGTIMLNGIPLPHTRKR